MRGLRPPFSLAARKTRYHTHRAHPLADSTPCAESAAQCPNLPIPYVWGSPRCSFTIASDAK